MSQKAKIWTLVILAALLTCLTCGLVGGAVYALRLPQNLSEQDTYILGQSQLIPGAPGALHVQVQRHDNAEPVEGASVKVSLKPQEGGRARLLYTGTTGPDGRIAADFTVPDVDDPAQELIVETRSKLGRDTLEQPVTVERSYKVLLTTDKPIYQPGQQILVRALALGAFDQTPAEGGEIELIIADAKGNKVFRETTTTGEWGVAAWEFQLASEVNHGNYKLTAALGDTTSEKTVVVKPYVLPKFKVNAATDDAFYHPGDRVTGQVDAAYFFGKPVDSGQVKLSGWVYDIERQQVLDLDGTTDAQGVFHFEFDLPDYFVGGAEANVADYILEVAITDGAAHTEQVSIRIPVAQQGILIEAVPEAGDFKPGLENILYLLTAYPDGAPAQCDVSITINGVAYQAQTGPYGLGELRFTPDSPHAELQLQAQDALGHTGKAYTTVEPLAWTGTQILLRPDRAAYRVGDTMDVEILTTERSGSVYLDITREGQTLSTRALDIENGQASAAVDLTPDLYGTLSLHAYKILANGEIVRDTRLVVVDSADDLALDIQLDRDAYLPGEQASLHINVSDQNGRGTQSALGLAVVDESVFALQEQDPGFAKLYFLLEKELLEPKFDLHGMSFPALMGSVDEPALRDAQNTAAKASLAGSGASPFGLQANSHRIKFRQAEERQARILGTISAILFPVVVLLPLAGAVALGFALWRERVLGRSLAVGVGLPLLALCWFIGTLWIIPLPGAPWADTPLDKFGYLVEQLGPALLCFILPVILGGVAGAIGLAVRAVRKGEISLGLALLMLVSYAFMLVLFIITLFAANPDEPPALAIVAFVLAYLALPLAFGARAAGYGFKRDGWALAATGFVAALAFFLITGPVLVLLGLSTASTPMAVPNEQLMLEAEAGMAFDAAEMPRAPMPQATQAPVAAMKEAGKPAGEAQSQQEAPLLRQFFPETMYWNPQAVTAADGGWQTELDLAHTITTWRLTALASAQDGRLGSATAPIRVFQDFFVDIDLPLALTQGDEVSMPVAVYNYLESGQQVELTLEEQDWFQALGDAVQVVDVEPGDVTVFYFPIKITATEGRFRPVVTAIGEKMSDATTLRHDVQVMPNGKRFDQTTSDRLTGDVEQTITIPAEAIPGTAHITVKVYPGILSQVVEGLDSLLRMPYGCFEQTSSTTYPNVLVLDYLKSTNQAAPETQMKAEEYINLGYQRLTTFEVPGGGFSLFGDHPADRMLTAYGLMEFSDMARVHNVDEAMIGRAAEWLLSQQQNDGSWENDRGLVHEHSWSNLKNDRLPVTAYIVWALVEAGYEDESGTVNGLDYVRESWRDAEDAYALALVANGLAAADPEGSSTQAALDKLADMAVVEGNPSTGSGQGGTYWPSSIATFMGATGETGSIETTALVAYAFLRAEQHTDLANSALTYLIQQKDSYGTWHSTQATVLTLKALLLSVRKGGEGSDATVTVSLNGEETDPIEINEGNFDVVQQVSFTDRPVHGDNTLRIKVKGKGNLMYQVSTRYYLPWDKVPMLEMAAPLMDIQVDYDRTELAVNDVINVAVRVELLEGAARQAIVDLGIPPGFEVMSEDLADLMARHTDLPADYEGAKFSRFDLTGRQIIVYLESLKAGQPLEFKYRLRARYPIKAQTPPSAAYDYYNPGVSGISAPAAIQVTP